MFPRWVHQVNLAGRNDATRVCLLTWAQHREHDPEKCSLDAKLAACLSMFGSIGLKLQSWQSQTR